MRNHHAPSARFSRAILPFIVFAVSLSVSPFPQIVLAQCPDPPTAIVETQVDDEGDGGGSIAMRECGEFIVVWERDYYTGGSYNNIDALRFDADGAAIGATTGLASVTSGSRGDYELPSVAISRTGRVFTAWTGVKSQTLSKPSVHSLAFDFDSFSFTPVTASTANRGDANVSAGTSGANVDALSWTNKDDFKGVEAQVIGAAIVELRDCDTLCDNLINRWNPCIYTRSEDGYSAVVFGLEEQPLRENSARNIALVMLDPSGNILSSDSLIGPDINDPAEWVNDPSLEDPDPDFDSDQRSPAVSFVGDDIVVAWAGPNLADCQSVANVDHIYARRFKFNAAAPAGQRLREPNPATEGRAGIFIVDSGTDCEINGDDPNAAVALSLATDSREGSFVVAWNANAVYTLGREEVWAQYFDSLGEPFGGPVRVNQATGVTDPDPGETKNVRRLGRSGSHTIAYGKDGQLVAVWSPYWRGLLPNDPPFPQGAVMTLLPPDYVETWCTDVVCLKGDCDNNGIVDGRDIQPFTNCLVNRDTPPWHCECQQLFEFCRYDLNRDCFFDFNDVPPFVAALLSQPSLIENGNADCNGNGTPDINDIGQGTSEDCNTNRIPDECDVDESDPDGNELASADVNTNNIPDECEVDCNGNDVPDDWDIAQATSADVNSNGVPDECELDCNSNGVPDNWDIAQATSADCNSNGGPDECEADCNTNGVPDDCDVDPSDPDGDEFVSADCNSNGYPDECDLALPPPLGSSDCNTNGVPDECDIAACESDPACDDCNENGIPDRCDIAAEISEDANTNGIPDECEGEGMMGGESMMAGEGGEGTAEGGYAPETWEAYYEWAATQCWGPACETTGAEQFAAMVAKLNELGLPVTGRPLMP